MARLRLIPKKPMNHVAAMHVKTQARLRGESHQIYMRAKANKATHVDKGYLEVLYEPHVAGLGKYRHIDYQISLHDPTGAKNDVAVHAIEFGSKRQGGLYILSRAAGLI